MSPKQDVPSVVPSINVPSADLIQYRFDQMEKRFDHLETSLQTITSHFINRSEVQLMAKERDERMKTIEDRLKGYQWYWRSMFIAVISAIALAAATFWIHR